MWNAVDQMYRIAFLHDKLWVFSISYEFLKKIPFSDYNDQTVPHRLNNTFNVYLISVWFEMSLYVRYLINKRPVYTGDFCCDLSGDFCCDFAANCPCKLLAIHRQ